MPPETESSTTDRDAAAAREDSKAVPVGRWKRDKGYPLVHFSELPHWQQDNHYIHKGYRKASYSYIHSLHSILHWHNESVNIWTHMIPGLSAIPTAYLFYRELRPRYELASKNDVYVMLCFFLGAGAGMTLSGLYHTLSNHSPSVAKFWNQLDYVGIALMIWGSFVPSVYYGFWCDGGLRTRYWSMVWSTTEMRIHILICNRSVSSASSASWRLSIQLSGNPHCVQFEQPCLWRWVLALWLRFVMDSACTVLHRLGVRSVWPGWSCKESCISLVLLSMR